MKKLGYLFLFLSATHAFAFAGNVNINLPRFAGKEYVYYLVRGDANDTIQRGTLDAKGQTTLTPALKDGNYRGMSRFIIVGAGGLEILLNNEADFTVSCTGDRPSISTIDYTGSEENGFLFGQHLKQGETIRKFNMVTAMLDEYSSDKSTFRKHLIDEQQSLKQQFKKLLETTAESPLYSARIREIGDFLANTGAILDMNEEELVAEQRRFVSSRLDFGNLYNSGFWHQVLDRWIIMTSSYGDSAVVADVRQALSRVNDDDIRRKLTGKLTVLFYRYGKENLLSQIGEEDLLSPGNKAPALTINGEKTVPFGSMIIFYESGCPNCEKELTQLRVNYRTLQQHGLRVISVAADHDEETFRLNADRLPWTDKYCDYRGVDGENFKSYNVIGTPTIFIIDGEGTITGRYAKLSEYLAEKQ
jgi:peroxiredoxin